MAAYQTVLFVGHGSPMFALEPGAAGEAMVAALSRLSKPRAVVVVSPHWETADVTVGSALELETLHDFGGFDPRLYQMRYPAQGSVELARRVLARLRGAGLVATEDSDRGLDHGAWIPLRHLFPKPDVPIVPLSIQHAGGPAHAYRVGRALAPLVDEDVLILGSGNITHNLQDWRRVNALQMPVPAYVQGFADWVHDRLLARDVDSLLNYRRLCPDGVGAQPRDEHLLPLFTALGAAGPDAQPRVLYRGYSDRVIAMDSYGFT